MVMSDFDLKIRKMLKAGQDADAQHRPSSYGQRGLISLEYWCESISVKVQVHIQGANMGRPEAARVLR